MMKTIGSALVFSLLALALSACMAYKPAASKGFGSHYEIFPLGDAGTQYFIKPLRFQARQGSGLQADITFRHLAPTSGLATLNFTLKSPEAMPPPERLAISNGRQTLELQAIKPLFTLAGKSNIEHRYTSTVDLPELLRLFEDPHWVWVLTLEGQSSQYQSPGATRRILEELGRLVQPLRGS
jgi:hypothetical protein